MSPPPDFIAAPSSRRRRSDAHARTDLRLRVGSRARLNLEVAAANDRDDRPDHAVRVYVALDECFELLKL